MGTVSILARAIWLLLLSLAVIGICQLAIALRFPDRWAGPVVRMAAWLNLSAMDLERSRR